MKDREMWLAERKTYIGASEIAAVCGIHPYDTPRKIWMVKKGLMVVEDNLPMKIGRLLENTVAQEFAKDLGVRPQALTKSKLVRHPKYPYCASNPDRFWRSPSGLAVVQCKTCNQFASGDFGKTGTDEVKDEYLMQVGWEMWTAGANLGFLAVLIGNNDFRWFKFDWTETMKAIVKRAAEDAREWWHEYYLADIPPPITGQDEDTRIVTGAYQNHDDELRMASPELLEITKDWVQVKAEHDRLAAEISRRKNILREFIGGSAGCKAPTGEVIATWKADKNGKRALKLRIEGEAA